MGKISTYPEKTTPAAGDFLLGDDTAGAQTARFKIQNIPVRTDQIVDNYRCEYSRAASWSAGSGGIIAMDTLITDVGSHYSTSTGKYTAPVTGTYMVCASVGYGNPGNGALITSLAVNGAAETWRLQETSINNLGNRTQSGAREVHLNAGDTVAVYARSDGGATGGTGITTWLTISLKSND